MIKPELEIEFTIDDIIPEVENAVRVADVSKSYGFGPMKKPILNGINLSIDKGTIYGLIGPSGCGKTTLLKLFTGLLRPDSGSITVFGNTVGTTECGIPGDAVGYMPQDVALFMGFTVKETLYYFGRIFHLNEYEIEERMKFLLDFLHIKNNSAYVKSLSGGQKRRLSFAVALIQNAPLLILDEPTVGVDPVLRQNIWNHLETLVQTNNVTVILTTHYIEEVQQTSKVGVMRDGHILDEDSPHNFLTKYRCSTLEDVFIKLCKIDNQQKKKKNYLKASDKYPQLNGVLHESRKQDEQYSVERVKQPFLNSFAISSHRTNAMVNKNWLLLRRNIWLLLIQFILPTVQLSLFCLALGKKPTNLPIGTIIHDTSDLQFGQLFFKSLDPNIVSLIKYDDVNVALEAVDNNNIWGLLYIPSNFSSNLLARVSQVMQVSDKVIEGGKIKIWLDKVDPEITYTLRLELLTSLQSFLRTLVQKRNINPGVVDLPVSFQTHDLEFKNESIQAYMMFLAPAILILVSYFVALGLTNLAFILERQQGLIDRTFVAGVRDAEMVFGFFITQGFVLIVQTILALIVMIGLFKVPCNGSVLSVIFFLLLQGCCGLFHGLMLSSIVDNEYFAIVLGSAFFIPSMTLSGCFWPIQAMPKFFQTISYILPLTYSVQTLRAILLRGWGVTYPVVWKGILISSVWFAFLIVATILCLRYRRRFD